VRCRAGECPHAGGNRAGKLGWRQRLFARGRHTHAQKKACRKAGRLAPPTLESSVMPMLLKKTPRSSPLSCASRIRTSLEAALHVDAVVGVADFGVQRRQ
jgi:hypothetical protein